MRSAWRLPGWSFLAPWATDTQTPSSAASCNLAAWPSWLRHSPGSCLHSPAARSVDERGDSEPEETTRPSAHCQASGAGRRQRLRHAGPLRAAANCDPSRAPPAASRRPSHRNSQEAALMDLSHGNVWLPTPSLGAGLQRLVRGRAEDGAWVRSTVIGVLALTAILYLWGLDRNGYANEYYAIAVQAGTQSWKAFLVGALDAGSFITVDKPPASLWLLALSGRIFGFSSWSMLAPEAMLGVATVG